MVPFFAKRIPRPRELADGLLIALLTTLGFLLACFEMFDADVWWHLRSGQWILEHGRVPRLDPFTFGSENRAWVDIHWAFEVLLASVYSLGGVAGMILLGASAGTAALLVAVTARRRDGPVAVLVLAWLPALLLMSWRFHPRPEIFTLLYLACYLAVLWRVEAQPALAWLLPLVQVLWVNMQGLFILGPIVLGFFLADLGAGCLWQRWRGTLSWGPEQKRWWRHVGGAFVAVMAACLVNPYFLDGARFPFDLYPKVADPDNPYKNYGAELMSPSRYVQLYPAGMGAGNWYIRSLYFLLLALPLSFMFPAAWRAWQAGHSSTGRGGGFWLGGLAAALALTAASTLALPGREMPGWIVVLGDYAVGVLVLGAVVAAVAMGTRSGWAALLALVGGGAQAAWMLWLRSFLLGPEVSTSLDSVVMPALVCFGLPLLFLALRWGASLFRLLLAAAFAVMALQAVLNTSRFGLLAGILLAWNIGEWISQINVNLVPGRYQAGAAWIGRLAIASMLGFWIVSLGTGRYYDWTREERRLGLRERPFQYAHAAARFAGQPGLPKHALVYDLAQAGVFVFHNAPERKAYLDGRLELPERKTFETYFHLEQWLHDNDRRWVGTLHLLGDPLVLLTHRYGQNYLGESTLLAHPNWRCIDFDAQASVFVPRCHRDLEDRYPKVDFAARHFLERAAPSVPDLPGAALRECRALVNLGTGLRRFPDTTWTSRIPVFLAALNRASLALGEEPDSAEVWSMFGFCHENLVADPNAPTQTPADGWDPFTALPWAQATFCQRQALELAPGNPMALNALFHLFAARAMADAQLNIGEQLIAQPQHTSQQVGQVQRLRQLLASAKRSDLSEADDLLSVVTELSRGFRPEAAVPRMEEAERRGSVGWSWPLAERIGAVYLQLGRPADARRAWQQVLSAPATGLRLCRLGDTYLVERDFEKARRCYQEARAAEPRLVVACWGLAMLFAQQGQAEPAHQACQQGLLLTSNQRQQLLFRSWDSLLQRYAVLSNAESRNHERTKTPKKTERP